MQDNSGQSVVADQSKILTKTQRLLLANSLDLRFLVDVFHIKKLLVNFDYLI